MRERGTIGVFTKPYSHRERERPEEEKFRGFSFCVLCDPRCTMHDRIQDQFSQKAREEDDCTESLEARNEPDGLTCHPKSSNPIPNHC